MAIDAPNSRERLLHLAAQAFAEDGYAGVSVRDLAARFDLTSGAIYHNFKGKADLLLAAIDAHIDEDLVDVPVHEDSVAAAYAEIFSRYPDRKTLRALMVEGAVAARTDDTVRDRLGQDHERRLAQWSDIYRARQTSGEIDPELDVRTVLVTLWAIELGLGVLEALAVDLPEPDDMADVVDHLITGLEPAGKRTAKRPPRAATRPRASAPTSKSKAAAPRKKAPARPKKKAARPAR